MSKVDFHSVGQGLVTSWTWNVVFDGGDLGKKFGLISVPNNSWEGLRDCWISFNQSPGIFLLLEEFFDFGLENKWC
jgi:hypothetical protein